MSVRKSEVSGKPARQILADEVARLREESGKSLSELADETTYDRAYLHKLEKGERIGSPEVMTALDTVYGTVNHLRLLWEMAKDGVFPDKYKLFIKLEQEATARYQYTCSTVPGLLQTEEYARDILQWGQIRDEHELEERVAARLSRQSVLRRPGLRHFRAVLDEGALRRPAADPKVWQGQLRALLTASEQPNITLQVLPFSAGLHGLVGGSTTILWLPKGRTVAYVEGSMSGALHEVPAVVDHLHLSYDLMRDSALSADESKALISQLMEDETQCEPA
ncbi:helix-turn-helix domain-containing protein [Streptomyces sp. NPDC055078]